jgi:hypothetical protein
MTERKKERLDFIYVTFGKLPFERIRRDFRTV